MQSRPSVLLCGSGESWLCCCKIHFNVRHVLHKYINEDVSLGSWFLGLDVEHIDDRRLCCGTPPGELPLPHVFNSCLISVTIARRWGHGITSSPQLCSQIANGKLRQGTPVRRHSTGSAAAYATRKAGSGRCTISAPRATRRCGIPPSSANETPTEAEEALLSCLLVVVY